MGLSIISPGLLTTIQDTGRFGFRKDGIIVSGAMDTAALRIGNILLGNDENEAGIEATLQGPEIYFEDDVIMALSGANLSPQINGENISMWKPTIIRKGCTLTFGRPQNGCRSYITFAGGLDIPKILNSASTYLRGGIGGWKGRALLSGDKIPTNAFKKKAALKQLVKKFTGPENPVFQPGWAPSQFLLPDYHYFPSIRIIPGPEWDWFTNESKDGFLSGEFLLTSQSDRMGYRLKGPGIHPKKGVGELLSTSVTFGTIQVPPEGTPFVLMADHPTTGGYPRIAQVITADLPGLAQLRPGIKIRFQGVSLLKAQQLFYQQEQNMESIKKALHIKFATGSYAQLFN